MIPGLELRLHREQMLRSRQARLAGVQGLAGGRVSIAAPMKRSGSAVVTDQPVVMPETLAGGSCVRSASFTGEPANGEGGSGDALATLLDWSEGYSAGSAIFAVEDSTDLVCQVQGLYRVSFQYRVAFSTGTGPAVALAHVYHELDSSVEPMTGVLVTDASGFGDDYWDGFDVCSMTHTVVLPLVVGDFFEVFNATAGGYHSCAFGAELLCTEINDFEDPE